MANLILAERYEILEKIGDGGMAVVFKARDRLLSRFVTVKVLKKEHINDTTFVNNFIREAKAAASLLHPNIVTIYDVGRDRDIYYIVMEYVEGRTLADVIAAEAPFDYKRVISIGKQMASALSLAHRNNIIHRDVKPHNILVTPDGTAKITDFGIAKAMGDGTIISENGMIMGSVHYFSPEQSRGQYVDEKSDIYSLGIVLYEMLTGRVPFDADNPVTIAVMHMNDSIIPPSRIVKGVPPGLDQIVLKATAKYQSDRFHDIDEMYRALDNVNYITGIIDDPEVAGFVAPVVIAEDTPGRGSSNAAGEPEGPFPQEVSQNGESAENASANRADEDEDEEDEDEEKGGFFKRLFAGEIGTDENGRLTKKWKAIAIIAAVVIALAIAIPLSLGILGTHSGRVNVPNVVGLEQAAAVAAIENEGLKTQVTTKAIAPEGEEVAAPAGAAAAAQANGAVSGASGSAAIAATPATGGNAQTIWVLPGQVLTQDPQAGSLLQKGATVTLTVATAIEAGSSAKPVMGVVPDVVGKNLDDAVAAIKAAGFRVG
ncbi:MAG: protein kinase, partial [Clostridiales bacterium]|nr:protein kinase [Clostridiales bacterium]